jgi:hypothetical protein
LGEFAHGIAQGIDVFTEHEVESGHVGHGGLSGK